MEIKQMTLAGVNGDVEIARTEDGALVTVGDRIVCELRRADHDETQFAAAKLVAGEVYGMAQERSHHGGGMVANATNSMIHDVWRTLQQVAGS